MDLSSLNNQHPTMSTGRTRNVVFLVPPQTHLLDLAGPAQAFDTAVRAGAPYALRYCSSQTTQVSAQGIAFTQLAPLTPVVENDLIIVPGIEWESFPLEGGLVDQQTRDWLYSAYQAGAYIASVCTGAFVLGEAKLLDGRRCTTHWAQMDLFHACFPLARVIDNVLFVLDRKIITSAGIASGIDMALALIEQDRGPMFAAQVARHLVVYMRRNGAQPQGSIYLQYRTHLHSGVHRAQDFLISHIAGHISLGELASIAGVSPRGLNRAFKESTGLTPVQYHQQLKLELASMLLSNPTFRIEDVAMKCGFEDVRHFRRLWQRQFGMSPSASRAAHSPL